MKRAVIDILSFYPVISILTVSSYSTMSVQSCMSNCPDTNYLKVIIELSLLVQQNGYCVIMTV